MQANILTIRRTVFRFIGWWLPTRWRDSCPKTALDTNYVSVINNRYVPASLGLWKRAIISYH